MSQVRRANVRSNGTRKGARKIDKYAHLAPPQPAVSQDTRTPAEKAKAKRRRTEHRRTVKSSPSPETLRFIENLQSLPDEVEVATHKPTPAPATVTPIAPQPTPKPVARPRKRKVGACAYESCDRVGKICGPGRGSFHCAQQRHEERTLEDRMESMERFVKQLHERYADLLKRVEAMGQNSSPHRLDECG